MSEPSSDADDPFDELLARLDDALAAGSEPNLPTIADSPPELLGRLQQDLASMRLLRHHLSPRRPVLLSPARECGLALTHVARFRLVRELGRGGSGIVYLAEDPQLGREVALKIPRPEVLAYPALRERFIREAQAAAALDHPNLVPVYEAGEHAPLCYIATAYCDGPTLAAWLSDRTEPAPALEAARLVSILADAVQHAHGRGILHRDLKPANILLEADCEQPSVDGSDAESRWGTAPIRVADCTLLSNPRITDFGLAKVLEADCEETASGVIIGTPCYMAPEQAAGHTRQLSVAVDVYALGAILYETLTLRPPFRDTSRLLTLQQVRLNVPVPPRALRPRVPLDLETICLKCLEKNPARRYATARDLAIDLRHFLCGEPIEARPNPWWERVGKWMRRRPVAAAALFTGGAAAIALVAMWLAFTLELRRERNAAAQSAREAEKQRLLAVANQDQALAAVDRFLARIGDRRLADVPEMDEVRRELLEDALGFCEQFLEQSPNPDRNVRFQAGRTHGRLAKILRSLSRFEPAEENYRRALAIFQQLINEYPDDCAYRFEFAKNSYNLSVLYRETRRGSEADSLVAQALDLQERLVQQDPRSRDFRRDLATTSIVRATFLRTHGQADLAEVLVRKVMSIREALCQEQPSDADAQADLARAHAAMGHLLFDTRRVAEAEPWFRLARDRIETLARARPQSTSYSSDFANVVNSLGVAYELLNRPYEAVAAYRQCVVEKMKLADKHPAIAAHRFNLGWSYTNLGSACWKSGQPEDAEAAYREGRKMLERLVHDEPENDAYALQLAKNEHSMARFQRSKGLLEPAEAGFRSAAAILETIVSRQPDNASYSVELALAHTERANVCTDKDDPLAALPWFERAFSLLDGVLKKNPRHTMALEFAHESHLGRALALTALGRYDQARLDWDAAVPFRLDAHTARHHAAWRALDLAAQRRFAQALAELRASDNEAMATKDLLWLYRLAQAHALIAAGNAADSVPPNCAPEHERERCARRAVELLETLRAKTYFENPRKREILQIDHTFNALRIRPEFVKLWQKVSGTFNAVPDPQKKVSGTFNPVPEKRCQEPLIPFLTRSLVDCDRWDDPFAPRSAV
jgi:serine/threonine protein kinase